MLDIKWIRENEKEFSDLLHKRGVKISVEELLSLDEEKRQLTMLIQQFQQAKNTKSKRLSGFKGKVSREFEDTKRDVQHINEKLAKLEE